MPDEDRTTMDPSTREPTSEELAAKSEIQDAFQETFGEGGEAPASPRKESEEELQEELEGLGEDDDGAAEDDPEADEPDPDDRDDEPEEEDGQEPEAEEPPESPTLNPLLRQAARRANWSEEDIDAFVRESPERAERTFHLLLENHNRLSAEYGRLGQVNQPDPNEAPPKREPEGRPENLLAELYGQERMDGLRAKYGEDLISDLIEPLIGPLRQAQQFAQLQEAEAIGAQVDQWLQSLPPEFKDMYGQGDDRTEEQLQALGAVGQRADDIRNGAARAGRDMPVEEALEAAHMELASRQISEVERKRLHNKVQRRSATRTQRPTSRSKSRTNRTGRPSEKAAEDAYRARAAELGVDL